MNERKYVYGIRLTDGRYVHAEGVDIADALRWGKLRWSQVVRYMSVKAIPTLEEVEATRKRIEALKAKKGRNEHGN